MAAAKSVVSNALLKSEVEWDTKPHFPACVLGCRIHSAALYVNQHIYLRKNRIMPVRGVTGRKPRMGGRRVFAEQIAPQGGFAPLNPGRYCSKIP